MKTCNDLQKLFDLCLIEWVFRKYTLKLIPATRFRKVGTQPCLPLWYITLFININSGTQGTHCWKVESEILANSCLMYDLMYSRVWGLCHIFCILMHCIFSMGDQSGLQAGHSRLIQQSHTVLTHTGYAAGGEMSLLVGLSKMPRHKMQSNTVYETVTETSDSIMSQCFGL